jgi:hypothetical protein
MTRTSRRRLTAVLGSLAALIAAGGLLHTRPGLRLMARVGLACPAAAVSPAETAALRAEGLAGLRGADDAPARFALGLSLDGSDEAAARSWAERRGATCALRRRGFRLLACTRDAGGGAREELTLAFDERDRLIAVDVMTRMADGAQAARLYDARGGALEQALGAQPQRAGDLAEVTRGRMPFATAIARHRYRDYLAEVTAVRLPSGILLREQYQSLRGAS